MIDGDVTRSRLCDAAIERFSRLGFGVALSEIESSAGVTPGTIEELFGSRNALRAECDAEILRRIRAIQTETMRRAASGAISMIQEIADQGVLFAYVLRSVREGGDFARTFIERTIEDTAMQLAQGEAAGLVKPTRDQAARARLLATQQLGSLLIELALLGDDVDLADGRWLLERFTEIQSFPKLELYTQGLLTSSAMLDAYLATQGGDGDDRVDEDDEEEDEETGRIA